MLSCQKRFISIGGRATRAGSGTAHSRTSIKQVSAIPTAPGSPGRVRDNKRAPLFVPLSRVTQPQLRLQSPKGKWKHIDTSFADLQGVSDLVITPEDSAGPSSSARDAGRIAEELLSLCHTFFTERAIAKFGNKDLVLNSGPEQDSIINYTLKRRQWFAIVRAFYHGRDKLWTTEDAVTIPISQLYKLVIDLDAASSKRISSPAIWEDEPKESYEPLPLKPLVEALAAAFKAQAPRGRGLMGIDASRNVIIGCASLATRYGVVFYEGSETVLEDLRASVLAMGNSRVKGELTIHAAIAYLNVLIDLAAALGRAASSSSAEDDAAIYTSQCALEITATGIERDPNVAIVNASKFLVPPTQKEKNGDGNKVSNHREALLAILSTLALKGSGDPFVNFDAKDLSTLIIFIAAARRANPDYFTGSSSLNRFVTMAVDVIKRMINGAERTIRDEEGYDGLRDYGRDLRLAHPDIHPHLALRTQHSERRRDGTADKQSIGHMLDAYTAYIRSCDLSTRFSSITQQMLRHKVERNKSDFGGMSFGESISTLKVAMEHYGPSARNVRVGELLSSIDARLSTAIAEELSAESCATCLELCAACAYLPVNVHILVNRLLKAASTSNSPSNNNNNEHGDALHPAAISARAANALCNMGYAVVGTYHSLATVLLAMAETASVVSVTSLSSSSTSAANEEVRYQEMALSLCAAACRALAPADADSVVDRVWNAVFVENTPTSYLNNNIGGVALPSPDSISPRAALECAQVLGHRLSGNLRGRSQADEVGEGQEQEGVSTSELAEVESFLVRALEGHAHVSVNEGPNNGSFPADEVVAALATCATLGVACPSRLTDTLRKLNIACVSPNNSSAAATKTASTPYEMKQIEKVTPLFARVSAAIGSMGVVECAAMLATIPSDLLQLPSLSPASSPPPPPMQWMKKAIGARIESLLVDASSASSASSSRAISNYGDGRPQIDSAENAPFFIAHLHASLIVLSQQDVIGLPSLSHAALRFIVSTMAELDKAENPAEAAAVAVELTRAEGFLKEIGAWDEAEQMFAEL